MMQTEDGQIEESYSISAGRISRLSAHNTRILTALDALIRVNYR